MESLLFFLGVIGFGVLIIAIHVMTLDANAVNQRASSGIGGTLGRASWGERSGIDRRSGQPVEFPLTLNGVVIFEDRRQRQDRRQVSMMQN